MLWTALLDGPRVQGRPRGQFLTPLMAHKCPLLANGDSRDMMLRLAVRGRRGPGREAETRPRRLRLLHKMAAADSEEEEEDLVCFGTPLEPLEEGERIKKPVPLQEQTVRDEKGRYKRFHGAFSGGFSAGYFNTVGSKEGWTPSAFVSSRQNKAEKTVLGPEDFMDEEDLGEHGIAPKEITISDVFASKSKDKIQEKARQIAGAAAPIPGATVLDEFIAPAKITIGIDLLQKMGWKEGQGIGPRVKRKPRKQKPEPGVKIYGCALPPGSEESEDEDDEYRPENVTFAPKDVIPVDLTPKENVHGLGYKGLDPTKALFGTSQQHLNLFSPSSENTDLLDKLQHSKGRKLGISGQAFGVGALEEEDDDIYATESLSRYDTVLKDEEPGDGLYGWTAPKQYKSKQDKNLGFQKSKGSEKEVRYIGKILDGFSLASTPMNSQIKIYPPPDLPKDYRPVHYFRPVIKASSENTHLMQALAESTGKLESDIASHSRHQKTASQRREMLGETSLQGPTTSVLEFLSDKDKERIRGVKQLAEQQMKIPELSQQPVHSQLQAPAWPSAPQKWQLHLGAQLATAGSGDFKPFAKDPGKQKRYEAYIDHLKHGKKDTLESCLDQSMTEWERGREQEEFSRAALLYKSSSSVLSSRFIHAKLEDDTDQVEVPRDLENDVTDKEAAAKMKMFGKLTREKFEWHPDKLLCKRFNVPDPYSESCIVGLPKVKRDKYSVFNFLTVSEPSPQALSQPTSTEIQLNSALSKPKKPSRWDVSDQDKKKKDAITKFISLARSKVDVQDQQSTPANAKDKDRLTKAISNEAISETIQSSDRNEEEEESRPSMDLFKAIFASSSDEKSSSSEEESDGEEQSATVPEPVAEPMELPDLLGSPLPDEQESKDITPEPPFTTTTSSKEVVDEGEEFGPRLPPAVSDTLLKQGDLQPTSSPEATRKEKPKKNKEKHKTKKEHKHKKEKKKKHKKHKHKGKHKSKKSEKNSDSDTGESSDGNSDEEKTDISPQELLKRLKRNLPVVK